MGYCVYFEMQREKKMIFYKGNIYGFWKRDEKSAEKG